MNSVTVNQCILEQISMNPPRLNNPSMIVVRNFIPQDIFINIHVLGDH